MNLEFSSLLSTFFLGHPKAMPWSHEPRPILGAGMVGQSLDGGETSIFDDQGGTGGWQHWLMDPHKFFGWFVTLW